MRWLILVLLVGLGLGAPRALRVKLPQPTTGGASYATHPGYIVTALALADASLLYHYAWSVSERWLALPGLVGFWLLISIYLNYSATRGHLPARGQAVNFTWQAAVMFVVLVNAAAISLQYVHPAQPPSSPVITPAVLNAPPSRPSS